MERLKKDMEKSKGGTVVLSTGLKDTKDSETMVGGGTSRSMEADGEEEEEEEVGICFFR
jgi:GPN-loop GTPase